MRRCCVCVCVYVEDAVGITKIFIPHVSAKCNPFNMYNDDNLRFHFTSILCFASKQDDDDDEGEDDGFCVCECIGWISAQKNTKKTSKRNIMFVWLLFYLYYIVST